MRCFAEEKILPNEKRLEKNESLMMDVRQTGFRMMAHA